VATQGTDKQVVRVTIFQQPYSLRASGDPAETEALAHGVDDLMNQIADHSSTSDPSRVAVLAALHLADKVRTLEARSQELQANLGDVQQRLQESDARAEKAEKALQEMESARREDRTKIAKVVDDRAANLYDRLTTLDARLADLLEKGSR
jgi:cell division protein ZapA (FtsZ GTPase activity inhibitor)